MVAWFPENMDSLVEIQGQTSVCCPMSPHGAGGPAKWSHDQSNGTRLTWKLRFKRIICSYVLPNLVFSAIHESFKRWSMVKLSLPIGKLRVVLVKFRAGWPLIADITSTSWVIHPQKGTIWANYIHWFPYWGWLGCIGIIPQYNELTLTELVFILPELTWTKAILGSFPLTNRLLTVKLWSGAKSCRDVQTGPITIRSSDSKQTNT